jgi:hypothetical protein
VQYLWNVGADTDVSSTTYWTYTGGSFSSGNAATMAAAIVAGIGDTQASALSSGNKFVGVRVTDMSSDTGGDATVGADVVGTRSGGILPADACAVVEFTIDRRYRGGKPRNFYPYGTASDLQTEQTWTDTALTGFLAQSEDLYSATAGVSAGGTTLTSRVSVSYYSGFTVVTSPTTGRARNVPTKRSTPLTYAVVNTAVSPYIGSQRRRIQRP